MPVQNLDKQTFDIISNMEPSTLVQNVSHQQLMQDSGGNSESDRKNHVGLRDVTLREWTTVGILCFVNLINYMDRFTVAGILTDIKTHFELRDDAAGLLQTVFIISYMVFAPLFGYLGDRYNRKLIMAFGVFLWSLTTLLGSFMNHYVGFIIFRALVGIGEASYSTIAPTIISDLFVKDLRSIMLAFFYFAIPVGSGLGYIIGSKTAALAGSWQWGLRVTPILGAIAVLLIIFVMIEPVRGQAEGHTHLQTSSWFKDIKLLSNNRSFMFSTLGFTCVAFVTGALAWWGPIFMLYGIQLQEGKENTQIDDVSLVFGVITMCSGLIGVPLGSFLGSVLKKRFPRADALICAAGLFISAPLILAGMLLIETNTVVCLVLIFFAELSLNLNWAIVADILLYVVIPTRRSTAEAIQILISHAFGDAGSPYLIGVISEALKIKFLTSNSQSQTDFKALQYALFSTCFVEVLGGIFFLLTAIYIVKDKNSADKETADNQMQPSHIYAEDTNSDSDQQRNLVS